MSKSTTVNYKVCHCASCGKEPIMTKIIKYPEHEISWYFCSEKCYRRGYRAQERKGMVVTLPEKVMFT